MTALLGSSHGDSRIVRKAYFEHPDYVPLLRRAYPLWDELGADIGRPLFVRTGALMIGAVDSAVVTGTLASAQRWGLEHEVLDRRGCRSATRSSGCPPTTSPCSMPTPGS